MTVELGTRLKALRLKYNVKAKDVADHIGKSAAYLTKLEKGEIKQVDQDLLQNMVCFVTDDEKGFDKLIEKLALSDTNDQLKEENWFMNFDLVKRIIPIPPSLAKHLQEMAKEVDVSAIKLAEYINQNEDLDTSFFSTINMNPDEVEKNIWHPYTIIDKDEEKSAQFIILNVDMKDIESLLNGTKDTCSHTLMFAIIYHLLKLKDKRDKLDTDKYELQDKAIKIMQEHKFYSILDRSNFEKQAKSREEYQELLSDFDRKNREVINGILSRIGFLSDYDVKYTNDKLQGILDNLKVEPSFALSYMAIPLKEMNKISVTARKQFIADVKSLVEKYAAADPPQESVELY